MKKTMTIAAAAVALASSAEAQWRTVQVEDRWGEPTTNIRAHSTLTAPRRGLDFPYRELVAQLHVDCNRLSLWFSHGPNLRGDSSVSVRVDGGNEVRFGQSGRDSWVLLHGGPRNNTLLSELRDGNRASVLVNWFRQGLVRFDFSLAGSNDAILKSCADGRSLAEVAAEEERIRRNREERNRLAEERRRQRSEEAAARWRERVAADRLAKRNRRIDRMISVARHELRSERRQRAHEACRHLDMNNGEYDACHASSIGPEPTTEEIRRLATEKAREEATRQGITDEDW